MKIIFAGTPDFSAPTLETLLASKHEVVCVYTQPDRPAGRGRKLQASPVKQCALAHNIAIEQPLNFKSNEALETLAHYQADLMIVVAYGLILPTDVLTLPRFGCINIHASLLPRWRGAAPIQRAISSGDKETGVTIMQMDKGLDTGDILLKASCPIEQTDTSSSLHDKLSALGAAQISQILLALENDNLNPIPQDSEQATYAEKLSKLEAKIDWQQPAENILRAIRAYNPWPVAHTTLDGQPLRIWQATALAPLTIDATLPTNNPPGMINVIQQRMLVACADQWIEIGQLQPANKRKMQTAEYLAAHNLDGKILG
jgi:methionyl-tRNA formyltransferase